MEALLIDEWAPEDDAIVVIDEASVSLGRQRAREAARAKGMGREEEERLAAIASELGMNQLRHAKAGRLVVREIDRGVEIVAADRGPGIANVPEALSGRPRASGSLGIGLSAVREHADEIDFDVRLSEGTCVRARKLVAGAPRRRQVGIFGRPYPGELRSGDHAAVRRSPAGLEIAVCDGLGHGIPARQASTVAISAFRAAVGRPAQILEACHHAVGPTRGGVMAIAHIDEENAHLDLAAVGNITAEMIARGSTTRFVGSSFVLGTPQRTRRVAAEQRAFHSDQLLVLFTDGLGSRPAIDEDLALLREPPILIAHALVDRFAHDNDDVLVVVVA